MAEQRVDSFFNVQKITGEAAEIKKSIDAIAESMAKALDGAKMPTFTGKGSGGGNTKEFDAMKKAFDSMQAANQKLETARKQQESQRNNELRSLNNYYQELEQRQQKYYNSTVSNVNSAISKIKERRAALKKEMDAIEYDMIGKENPKGRHSVQKDMDETKAYFAMLKSEYDSLAAAQANLSSKGFGGKQADMKAHVDNLTDTNFELQQMNAYYAQLEKTSARTAKQKAEFDKFSQKTFERDMKWMANDEKNAAREAQNAAKKIGYLNNLQREVSELTAKVFQLENVESNEAKQLINTLTSKREELAKYKAMWGDHTMRVGEYSRATNGLR